MQRRLAHPAAEDTFRRCMLDLAERERHAPAYRLHRDLLALRRDDPVLRCRPARVDGAVIGEHAWVLRFFAEDCRARRRERRLLIVNLGLDLAARADAGAAARAARGPRLADPVVERVADPMAVAARRRSIAAASCIIPGESAVVLQPGPLTPEAAPELQADNAGREAR